MNPIHPSFIVAESVLPDGLTGRNCGTKLEVGVKFNQLRRTRYFGAITNIQSEDVGKPQSISLTLKRIETYSKTIDELDSGMTALLEFDGASLSKIQEELRELPEKQYLTIEAI